MARDRIPSTPVREWLSAVNADPAFADVLDVGRPRMVHRTDPLGHYASAGEPQEWEDLPPHHNAPGLCIGSDKARVIGTVDPLAAVTQLAERHVRSVRALVESGEPFP